jgi:hypothetical protein
MGKCAIFFAVWTYFLNITQISFGFNGLRNTNLQALLHTPSSFGAWFFQYYGGGRYIKEYFCTELTCPVAMQMSK